MTRPWRAAIALVVISILFGFTSASSPFATAAAAAAGEGGEDVGDGAAGGEAPGSSPDSDPYHGETGVGVFLIGSSPSR
jgi:hypothetical protein